MNIARRNFAAGAATSSATIAMLRYPAGAAEFSYKLAHNNTADHPVETNAAAAADKIKQESGGRLEIRTFPSGTLGDGVNIVTQARLGAIEFVMPGDNVLSAVAPSSQMSGIPFSFASYQQAWSAMDGPLGKYVRNAIDQQIDFYTFEKTWDIGFRQMENAVRPINGPDDLKGLRWRSPTGPMPVAAFKALGMAPTPIGAAEIYSSLQTHLVDGTDGPLSSTVGFKLYEVTKYASITNHIWTGCLLHVNAAAWQRLPKNLRDIAERHLNAAGVLERSELARGEPTYEQALVAHGMVFTRPKIAPFKAVLQAAGLYAQWRQDLGVDAWTLLEKAVGRLA